MDGLIFFNNSSPLYYFWDAELFKSIPIQLGITKSKMSKDLAIPRVTMYRWFEDGNCDVKYFVKMCNLYHIRPSQFVTLGERTGSVPKLIQRQFDSKWNFKFSPEHLAQHFGEDCIPWLTASEISGHARNTIKRWCSDHMRMTDLVYMCNTFWINAGDIISDSTLQRLPRADMSYYEMKTELLEMKARLERMKAYVGEQPVMFSVAEEDKNNK